MNSRKVGKLFASTRKKAFDSPNFFHNELSLQKFERASNFHGNNRVSKSHSLIDSRTSEITWKVLLRRTLSIRTVLPTLSLSIALPSQKAPNHRLAKLFKHSAFIICIFRAEGILFCVQYLHRRACCSAVGSTPAIPRTYLISISCTCSLANEK